MDVREKLVKLLRNSPHLDVIKGYKGNDCTFEQGADWLISHGVTVQKWMPANEPPKDNTENQWVIYKVGGSYFHSTGYYDGKNWRSAITDFKIQIAGWMPLPEPPKGE